MTNQTLDTTIALLLSLQRKRQLAHFYHLCLSAFKDHKSQNDWQLELMTALITSEIQEIVGVDACQNVVAGVVQNGHPDLLLITPKSGHSYVQDDFEEFYKVLSYHPLNWHYRYIFIHDAQCLARSTLSNKLLKSLEEPPQGNVIFFLNPTHNELLATVESRAIFLRPSPTSATDDGQDLLEMRQKLEQFKHLSAHEIIDAMRPGKGKPSLPMADFCRAVLKLALEQNSLDQKSIEKLIEAVALYEKSQAFNNPESERFLPFAEFLRTSIS